MHSYLNAVGFDQVSYKELYEILNQITKEENKIDGMIDEQGNRFVEYSKNFGDSIGITVCGIQMEDGRFVMDHYYPYFIGTGITSEENMEIEKRSDKESYIATCDEMKIGISIVFFIQNAAEYFKEKENWEKNYMPKMSATISGLSLDGKILLPISKSEMQILNEERMTQNRNHLLAAARAGDEEAIESLTLEDIDLYSMLSKRIVREDILSIVDSYFMPYGVESDRYSVLGEILNVAYTENVITGQKIFILTVDTNNLVYDICVNEKNLLGEPLVGRRFKGTVWLQGSIKIKN